jgi:hypothetical protein
MINVIIKETPSIMAVIIPIVLRADMLLISKSSWIFSSVSGMSTFLILFRRLMGFFLS